MTKLLSFDQLLQVLSQKISAAGWDIPIAVQKQLIEYILLLHKWNHAYNLTSVHEPEKMIVQHILDSLAVLPYLEGKRVIDVGSGAGLPGIPLALVLPQYHFVLLDSNGKKIRFMQHVVQTLQIANIEIVQERVENYKPDICFDVVIARAFSALKDFLVFAEHLCKDKGKFLAMKGHYPEEEIKAIPDEFLLEKVYALQIPGLDAKRHLICIIKKH